MNFCEAKKNINEHKIKIFILKAIEMNIKFSRSILRYFPHVRETERERCKMINGIKITHKQKESRCGSESFLCAAHTHTSVLIQQIICICNERIATIAFKCLQHIKMM